MWKFLFIFLLTSCPLIGTQTALFWTYATTDVVPTGKAFFEWSDLFKVRNHQREGNGIFASSVPEDSLPTDFGLDVGLFTWGIWETELGADYFAGINAPLFFNAKTSAAENKLFRNAPSLSFGIFGIGTTRDTDFNVFDITVGKSLPRRWGGGRIFFGGYYGNSSLGPDRGGWWFGYDLPFLKRTSHKGVDYYRWHLITDYASGRNFVGGGGLGLAYFINPNITFATGPTWFNHAKTNGSWKWSFYLNVVFPVFRKEKCCR
jgi:hypothetical protein